MQLLRRYNRGQFFFAYFYVSMQFLLGDGKFFIHSFPELLKCFYRLYNERANFDCLSSSMYIFFHFNYCYSFSPNYYLTNCDQCGFEERGTNYVKVAVNS